MAVVGLEQAIYAVSEGVGYVELCAVVIEPTIVCPINFSFNVRLQTADVTAGKNSYSNIHCNPLLSSL